MDERTSTPRCANCAVLEAKVAELEARLAELESRLAKLAKNSGNSSKPPSSDLVKPAAAAGKQRRSQRKRGAQPGHPKHERPAFLPEEIDRLRDYPFERCPDCDGPLEVLDQPARVLQQIEIVARPTRITIGELAKLVVKATGASSPIRSVDPTTIYGQAYRDAPDKFPTADRLRSLGWQPKWKLAQTVEAVHAWLRNMPLPQMRQVAGLDR